MRYVDVSNFYDIIIELALTEAFEIIGKGQQQIVPYRVILLV